MALVLAIGIATGCVYAIVAMGYSLIYRTTAIVNFAQGSYVMIGGLTTYWFFGRMHLPYPVAICGGILCAAATGALIGSSWKLGPPKREIWVST